MTSILEQQAELEYVGDDALAREAQQPSGRYPMYLVASEIERRKTMRERYQAQQAKAKAAAPPIIEQRMASLQQGIPMADPGMGQQHQNNPALAQDMSGGIMQAQQPQAFQEGGLVGDDDPEPWSGAWARKALKRFFLPPAEDWGPVWRNLGANIRDGGAPQPDARAFVPYGTPMDGGVASLRERGRQREMGEAAMMGGSPYPGPVDYAEAYRSGLLGGAPRERPEVPYITEWENNFQSLLGDVTDAREQARGYLAPGVRAAGDLVGSIDETREDLVGGMEEISRRRDELAEERAAELEEMSAVERAYLEAMRDPEEAADSRREFALAQLGALVGSARALGDIPAGMGEIYRETRDIEEADRLERNQMALGMAQAADARDAAQYVVLQQNLEQAGLDARAVATMSATMTGAQSAAINSMVSAARQMAQGEMDAVQASANIRTGLAALQQWTTENIERDAFTRSSAAQLITALTRFLSQAPSLDPMQREQIQQDVANLSRFINVDSGFDTRPGPVSATDEFIQQMDERLGGGR